MYICIMTETDFIIAYFRYLGYKFIDEYNYSGGNKLLYENGDNSISVYFDYNTEKVSLICESYDMGKSGFVPSKKYKEYLDSQDKDIMRDFKISLLVQ
jgi:hypothetical protein